MRFGCLPDRRVALGPIGTDPAGLPPRDWPALVRCAPPCRSPSLVINTAAVQGEPGHDRPPAAYLAASLRRPYGPKAPKPPVVGAVVSRSPRLVVPVARP